MPKAEKKGKFLGETEEEMGNKNVAQKRAPFSCGQARRAGSGREQRTFLQLLI